MFYLYRMLRYVVVYFVMSLNIYQAIFAGHFTCSTLKPQVKRSCTWGFS